MHTSPFMTTDTHNPTIKREATFHMKSLGQERNGTVTIMLVPLTLNRFENMLFIVNSGTLDMAKFKIITGRKQGD